MASKNLNLSATFVEIIIQCDAPEVSTINVQLVIYNKSIYVSTQHNPIGSWSMEIHCLFHMIDLQLFVTPNLYYIFIFRRARWFLVECITRYSLTVWNGFLSYFSRVESLIYYASFCFPPCFDSNKVFKLIINQSQTLILSFS